jgi:hypothetical protein
MEKPAIVRRAIGLVVLALVVARAAGAQVPAVETPLQGFLDAVGNAIAQVLGNDGGAASAELTAARTIFAELETAVQDPNARAALGKQAKHLERSITALGRAFGKAQAAVDDPRRSLKRKLKALKTVYARGLKVASRLEPPVIEEVRGRSAGFHRPGDNVTFRVLAADGSPCNETPTVTVENQYASSAVDVSSVATHTDGTITLTMGSTAGGARVTVTACGRSTTRLLFNYGPKVGNWFPSNLPPGTYEVSYSASGEVNVPKTILGTFPVDDVAQFAQELDALFDQFATAYKVPGCSEAVHHSRFDGSKFSVTLSISCAAGPVSVSETIRFTVRKVG